MGMVLLLIVAVIIIIVILDSQKNSVKYHMKKLSTMSDDDLKGEISTIALKLILHDQVVKSKGRYQADRICKYEERCCNNYQEVIMYRDAVITEMDRRNIKA